jgi:hypothetical protein
MLTWRHALQRDSKLSCHLFMHLQRQIVDRLLQRVPYIYVMHQFYWECT